MNVEQIVPIGREGVQTSTTSSSQATVDYSTFLQLLIAQMENQDPLNPMDSSEYVAQLATFSQVEQSIQINTKLDGILANSIISQSESLIGRTITSHDGTVSGEVTAVQISDTGSKAILSDGRVVEISSGIKIS